MPVTLKLEEDAGQAGIIQMVGDPQVKLNKEDQASGTFFVILKKDFVKETKIKVKVGLYSGDKRITTLKTNFIGPFKF